MTELKQIISFLINCPGVEIVLINDSILFTIEKEKLNIGWIGSNIICINKHTIGTKDYINNNFNIQIDLEYNAQWEKYFIKFVK